MNLKDLFDVLDPETWPTRPLTKIFFFNAVDFKELTQEELRQVMFRKIAKWAGNNLDKIETMQIERFIDDETSKPGIQIRFTVKTEG
jgi:hypothetical protein